MVLRDYRDPSGRVLRTQRQMFRRCVRRGSCSIARNPLGALGTQSLLSVTALIRSLCHDWQSSETIAQDPFLVSPALRRLAATVAKSSGLIRPQTVHLLQRLNPALVSPQATPSPNCPALSLGRCDLGTIERPPPCTHRRRPSTRLVVTLLCLSPRPRAPKLTATSGKGDQSDHSTMAGGSKIPGPRRRNPPRLPTTRFGAFQLPRPWALSPAPWFLHSIGQVRLRRRQREAESLRTTQGNCVNPSEYM